MHTSGEQLRKTGARRRKCARRAQGTPLISNTVHFSIIVSSITEFCPDGAYLPLMASKTPSCSVSFYLFLFFWFVCVGGGGHGSVSHWIEVVIVFLSMPIQTERKFPFNLPCFFISNTKVNSVKGQSHLHDRRDLTFQKQSHSNGFCDWWQVTVRAYYVNSFMAQKCALIRWPSVTLTFRLSWLLQA